MASAAAVDAPAVEAGAVHRLSYEDVIRMVEAGILDDKARVELREGVLIDMSPQSIDHEQLAARLNRHFTRAASEAWEVRVASTLLVQGGYNLPDIMLVPVKPDKAPDAAHLVIEVAKTSHIRDREKVGEYALIDVPEYWIVDVPARSVIVHRRPVAGRYEQVETFGAGKTIEPLLSGAPAVAVDALFGAG